MAKKKNFYEVLSVTPDSSDDEIRAAYLRLAQDADPNLSRTFSEKTKRVKLTQRLIEAFAAIETVEKRRAYNTFLETGKPVSKTPSDADRKEAVDRAVEIAFELQSDQTNTELLDEFSSLVKKHSIQDEEIGAGLSKRTEEERAQIQREKEAAKEEERARREQAKAETRQRLERDAKRRELPNHIAALNEGRATRESLLLILGLAKESRERAKEILRQIHPRILGHQEETASLRETLQKAAPSDFRNHVLLNYIEQYNTGENLSFYANQLLTFVREDGSLAERLIEDLDPSYFGYYQTSEIRDALYQLRRDAFRKRVLSEHIVGFNAGKNTDYYARWLWRFLKDDETLADELWSKLDPKGFKTEEGQDLLALLVAIDEQKRKATGRFRRMAIRAAFAAAVIVTCGFGFSTLIDKLSGVEDPASSPYEQTASNRTLSEHIEKYNETGNAFRLLQILKEKPELAEELAREIDLERLLSEKSSDLVKELRRLAPDAFMERILAPHIEAFNKGGDNLRHNAAQLLSFLKEKPELAKSFIEQLDLVQIERPDSEELRAELWRLDFESCLARALPSYIKSFNQEDAFGSFSNQILKILKEKPDLAKSLIEQLGFFRLVHEDSKALRDELSRLAPALYTERAISAYIGKVNGDSHITFYAKNLAAFLKDNPALSQRIVQEISFKRLESSDVEPLRKVLLEIEGDAYVHRAVAYHLDLFNKKDCLGCRAKKLQDLTQNRADIADEIIKKIDFSLIGYDNETKAFRDELYRLSPQKYRGGALQEHIGSFNKDNYVGYYAEQLEKFVKDDKSLVKNLVQVLNQDLLFMDKCENLRRTLRQTDPAAYFERYLPAFIKGLNDGKRAAESAESLLEATKNNPDIAKKLVATLTPEALYLKAAAELRTELYRLDPNGYIEKTLPNTIQSFNKDDSFESSQKTLLAFLGAKPELAKNLIENLAPHRMEHKAAKELRAELIRLAPEAYQDAVLSWHLVRFKEIKDLEYHVNAMLALINEGPATAQKILQPIDLHALGYKESAPLRRALYALNPVAYRKRAVPHHVEKVNEGKSRAYYAAELVNFVKDAPDCGKQILQSIDFNQLFYGDTIKLRDTLYETDSKAYMDSAIPHHVKNFNEKASNSDVSISELVRFINKEPARAKTVLKDIDVWRLGNNEEAILLRDILYISDRDAYIERALPEHIEKFNKQKSLPYYTEQLLRFVKDKPEIAEDLASKLNPEALLLNETKPLREELDRIREEQPQKKTTTDLRVKISRHFAMG